MIVMWPIAIILELFVVEKIAQSLTFRLVDSQADHLFHITIILCSMIVCLMCPMMSFIATFLFKNAGTVSYTHLDVYKRQLCTKCKQREGLED